MLPDIIELCELVRSTAQQELMPRFERVSYSDKQDGSLITEADLAMQHSLCEQLLGRWPDIKVLGEEMEVTEQEKLLQQAEEGLWILDPLDGTSNFATNIPFFSVSLALLQQGEIVQGIVYDPVRDESFSAVQGEGAYLNQQKLSLANMVSVTNIVTAIVDFKRLTPELANKLITNPPYKSQRSFGSVALDWCWMAASRGHVYLHGNQNLWDYAAGQLVLKEAGGYSSTLNGEPVFNQTLAKRSAVAAINQQLYKEWFSYLQSGSR
jgi:myo-inositol-1(or 4)-monophosphatase